MDGFYNPIDFSKIIGYPHELPEAAIENSPAFRNGDNANSHIKAFWQCINKWCDAHIHEDVLMKLFVMTLEDDAYDWFHDLEDYKFKTIQGLIHAFLERWGDRHKDFHWLDASTTPIKKLTEVIKATKFICVNSEKSWKLTLPVQVITLDIQIL
jgi:hypothetical protein